jgi:KDO2-lipid IV(A) lauroyltransferase
MLFFKLLSDKQIIALGKILGDILRLLDKKRYNYTLINIKMALGDNIDYIGIAKKSYQNLGITLAEILVMKNYSDEELSKKIKIENTEIVEEILSRNKGVIFLSGHYGNWEMLAYATGAKLNKEITVVANPLKHPVADKFLNSVRTNKLNKVLSKYAAAKDLVKQLKNNGMIALLTDQTPATANGVIVDFFGIPTLTYEAPAVLALKFKVPILVAFAVRNPDYTYTAKLEEINYEDLIDLDSENAILTLTQRHVTHFENQIRKHPEQWAWQHRRWKHTLNIYNV